MCNNLNFGYIRVSSKDQNEARQVKQMQELGIEERNIFVDKQSGKDFDRPQYKALLSMLREGDCLYVSSIDRLGRNYQDILEQWTYITKTKKANIVVLDMPLLDTRNDRDLTGILISDIVLQLLSYVAQKERENIRKRQAEGIAIAKTQGKYIGRKPIDIDVYKFKSLYADVIEKECTVNQAMKKLGVRSSTWYRLVEEYKSGTGRFAK